MQSGLLGADTEDMRRFAKDLDLAANTLNGLRGQLSAKVSHGLQWEGPDAFMFRHAWQSSYAPVIAKSVQMLHETAVKIRSQAAAQEAASS